MRLGEALALQWSDIDWRSSALMIGRTSKLVASGDGFTQGVGGTKGDRARSVSIDSVLLAILRKHQATQGRIAGFVFPRPGDPEAMLYRQYVWREGHRPALKAAGLPSEIRVHDLRHTFASNALAAGESLFWVSRQLGHRNISITADTYGHVVVAASREAAERRSLSSRLRRLVVEFSERSPVWLAC